MNEENVFEFTKAKARENRYDEVVILLNGSNLLNKPAKTVLNEIWAGIIDTLREHKESNIAIVGMIKKKNSFEYHYKRRYIHNCLIGKIVHWQNTNRSRMGKLEFVNTERVKMRHINGNSGMLDESGRKLMKKILLDHLGWVERRMRDDAEERRDSEAIRGRGGRVEVQEQETTRATEEIDLQGVERELGVEVRGNRRGEEQGRE